MNRKKPLVETNPYLRDTKQRAELIRMSVLTSSAVEGIYVDIKPLPLGQQPGKSESLPPVKS